MSHETLPAFESLGGEIVKIGVVRERKPTEGRVARTLQIDCSTNRNFYTGLAWATELEDSHHAESDR